MIELFDKYLGYNIYISNKDVDICILVLCKVISINDLCMVLQIIMNMLHTLQQSRISLQKPSSPAVGESSLKISSH